MNDFTFYSPTEFIFGVGGENKVGQLCLKHGAKKVLIHYGGGSAVRSGLIDRVSSSLSKVGLAYVTLGGVCPNPRSGLVYEGIEISRKENVDFILAVGGGSTIDSSKAIALGTVYDGDFWDFYEPKKLVTKALPVGTVLTIPAAGSEGSPNSVITKEETRKKTGTSGDILRPRFSVLNPELCSTLPAYQTACGIADIMAHVFERYFSNTSDTEITDNLCEAVLKTVIKEAPRVMKDPCDIQARGNIMWAGMLAHNNTCGVGREQDWASHGLEHELSALYDVAHGAGLAVIFPAWMKFVYKHDIPKFVRMAVNVFGITPESDDSEVVALKGIEALIGFWNSLSLPHNFAELGASEKDIPKLAGNISYSKDGTFGNFVKLTEVDVKEIYGIAAQG